MARFAAEALDVTFRIARGVVTEHEPLRLLLTRVKAPVLRAAEDLAARATIGARGGRAVGMDLVAVLLSGVMVAPAGPGLRFIDVGQGNALLMIGAEGHAVMIDAGPPGAAEAVIHALDEHELLRVHLWIHNHFDADHVGGLARATVGADGVAGSDDDFDVLAFWDRGLEGAPATESVAAYREVVGDRRREAAVGDRWDVPGLRVMVVDTGAPPGLTAENAGGWRCAWRSTAFVCSRPAILPAEQAAVAAAACGPVDLLWAAHHGSVNGTSEAVLTVADPALVVISAGRDNPYCHPSAVTLARLH